MTPTSPQHPPDAPPRAADLATAAKALRAGRRPARPAQDRALQAVLLASDAAMLAAALAAAYWLRFHADLALIGFLPDIYGDPQIYRRLGAVIFAVLLALYRVNGLYDLTNLLGGTREYRLVFNTTAAGMIVVLVGMVLAREYDAARGWLLMSWALGFIAVAAARFWIRRAVYTLRRRGWFLTPALIVGVNEEATALAEQLGHWPASGLNVLGFVAAEHADGRRVYRNLFALGGLEDLERLVERFGVQEVIVATSGVPRADLVDIFRRFAGHPDVRLRLSGGLFEIITTGLQVHEVAYVPLLTVAPVRLKGVDVVLKGAMDYGIALAAAIVGAPVLVLLAMAVKLDSPGPVLHRRRVLGLGGRPFDAYKFRTMHVDGDAILARRPELQAELAREHKLKDDPRVTRVGRVLRALSLDELPQLFNVLAGQMSIVGPRMIAPGEHAMYGQWDMNLLTVKPGITGLWQVSGRSDLTYDERVRLDMNYIRNWTIWLDLQLLLQTVPAVLGRRGAY